MIYVFVASTTILIVLCATLFLTPSKGRHRHPENLRRKRNEEISYTTILTDFGPLRVIEDPKCPSDTFYFVAQDKDIF